MATLGNGAFFGEVALVTHAPRAADVVAASSKVKLLSLGRDAFERLMGEMLLHLIKDTRAGLAYIQKGRRCEGG